MIRRILKDQEIPSWSPSVDLYNAISLKYVIPAGGEDLAKVQGTPRLCLAKGNEVFTPSADVNETPDAGEAIWQDAAGVTCRRWNWRQCQRTLITDDTKDAYFMFDCLPPLKREDLVCAMQELATGLRELGAAITMEIVSRNGAIALPLSTQSAA
jgi:DNA/RNA-binding domain of Phe-tRNA-synthetase-like protein